MITLDSIIDVGQGINVGPRKFDKKNKLNSLNKSRNKGTFLSEDTDVFVISPNRQTSYFPELENLNFGD